MNTRNIRNILYTNSLMLVGRGRLSWKTFGRDIPFDACIVVLLRLPSCYWVYLLIWCFRRAVRKYCPWPGWSRATIFLLGSVPRWFCREGILCWLPRGWRTRLTSNYLSWVIMVKPWSIILPERRILWCIIRWKYLVAGLILCSCRMVRR